MDASAEIDAAKAEVLKRNHLVDAYVRPIAWRGSEMMGVSAQHNKIHLGIAVWDWPSYFDPAQRMKGIRLDIADYRRPDPATAPALAKAAGLYMICTISKHRAERRGYADALMMDWQGRVAECTGANIFFVKNGVIHTPIADCFLAGITRATVIDLARRRGFEVVERRIMPAELGELQRMFHHRHRGRSDAGRRDRPARLQARGGDRRRSSTPIPKRSIRKPRPRDASARIAPAWLRLRPGRMETSPTVPMLSQRLAPHFVRPCPAPNATIARRYRRFEAALRAETPRQCRYPYRRRRNCP